MKQTNIGLIGCGVISNTYLNNIRDYYHTLNVVACADIFIEKARETAQKYNIPKACSVDELLMDPNVDIVLNLTVPSTHYQINMQALNAGKHVYCEKPLALTLKDAKETIDMAEEKNLLLGCAPDTFLGSAIQTCRKLIDDGWIGKPVAATANMISHGVETWHPSPEFYYKSGGGPMLDMGPYYITALVSLLGPIQKTSCFTTQALKERTIYSTAKYGEKIKVEIPTHYSGIMKFQNDVVANINMSFDVWLSNLPKLEIYGTEGTLIVPDPNNFNGVVKLLRSEELINAVVGLETSDAAVKLSSPETWDNFKEIPHLYRQPHKNMRGIGLLDMSIALKTGEKMRAGAKLAYHVTEALLSFDEAMYNSSVYEMISTCVQPKPVPIGIEENDFKY